jgi:hypothetical protein
MSILVSSNVVCQRNNAQINNTIQLNPTDPGGIVRLSGHC